MRDSPPQLAATVGYDISDIGVEHDMIRAAPARRATPTLGDDPDVMADLFRHYGEAIYNYCFRRTGNWATAEDLTSQVFLAAWQARRKAKPHEGSYAPWLYGIANNVCRTHTRSRRRGAKALLNLMVGAKAQTPITPERSHEEGSRVHAILERVETMPRGHQEVFFLVLWEGLDYAAAAAALDVPIGTVRSRLSRVRATLRLTDGNHHD